MAPPQLKLADIYERLHQREAYNFMYEREVHPLAVEFAGELQRRFPRITGTIAELACGTGIESVYLAGRFPHATIKAYDICPNAQTATANRSQRQRVNNVFVHTNYRFIERLKPQSLVGALTFSGIHYDHPTETAGLLRILADRLQDRGVFAQALKTPDSSWPADHQRAGEEPEQMHLMNGVGSAVAYRDDGVLRWYYTLEQQLAMAEQAGLVPVEGWTPRVKQVVGYDREGKTEHFARLLLTRRKT